MRQIAEPDLEKSEIFYDKVYVILTVTQSPFTEENLQYLNSKISMGTKYSMYIIKDPIVIYLWTHISCSIFCGKMSRWYCMQ